MWWIWFISDAAESVASSNADAISHKVQCSRNVGVLWPVFTEEIRLGFGIIQMVLVVVKSFQTLASTLWGTASRYL